MRPACKSRGAAGWTLSGAPLRDQSAEMWIIVSGGEQPLPALAVGKK